ncbi:MAG: hypothetical protein HZB46_01925 [Solirubrobacterales bacterium]|nr:hypothetical protein [Solirubrobacterales bacterium]
MLAAVALAAAPAQAATVTGSLDDVSATLSWTQPEEYGSATDVRLSITKGGVTSTPAFPCEFCMLRDDPSTVAVVDFDRESGPEVLVESYSGGAHCCWTGLLYYYDGEAWKRLDVETGNQGYQTMDLDSDGRTEIVTRDDRFAGAFTAYAASAAPVKVLQFEFGTLRDLTRERKAYLRQDARRLRKELRSFKRGVDRRGFLAAYVAEEYLLGEGAAGRRELDRNQREKRITRGFRRLLLKRLHAWGYR